MAQVKDTFNLFVEDQVTEGRAKSRAAAAAAS